MGFHTATIEYARAEDRGPLEIPAGSSELRASGITSFSARRRDLDLCRRDDIVLSFLYGLVIVAKTLVFGIDVPGYASLLVSVLFLGGIQLLGIGIIGQYLGRVYAEIKQRPIYIVRRTFGVTPS